MMTNFANENRGQNSTQWLTAKSRSADVAVIVYTLEIITKVGKYFPVLFVSLASLNVLMAANDFLSSNIEFGILNSMFAASGFVFVIQLHQDKVRTSKIYNQHHSIPMEVSS